MEQANKDFIMNVMANAKDLPLATIRLKGLSIGGIAEIVSDPQDIQRAVDCLLTRFPQAAEWAETGQKNQVAFLKICPQVISMLDYAKGFGHTETIRA